MNEEKKYDEQVKNCIRQVCESGKYDVDFDEFNIDVSFHVAGHIGNLSVGSEHVHHATFSNVWDLSFETKLTEKNGKFNHSIISSLDPKYVAACAVFGYVQTRDKYREKKEKEEQKRLEERLKKENSIPNFLKKLDEIFDKIL